MFAPLQDRDRPGEGFTHKPGDVVTIRARRLGALVNVVNYCDKIAPWTFGTAALMHNLAARGLLLTPCPLRAAASVRQPELRAERSEEHTSELQSLMRKSYHSYCLKKKK